MNTKHRVTFLSRLLQIAGAIVVVALLGWNLVVHLDCQKTIKEYDRLKTKEQTELAQIAAMEKWQPQWLQVDTEQTSLRGQIKRLQEACVTADDFLGWFEGEFSSIVVHGRRSLSRTHLMYLPPGKHRLELTVTKATRFDGKVPEIVRGELVPGQIIEDPSFKQEILKKRAYVLEGGKAISQTLFGTPTEDGEILATFKITGQDPESFQIPTTRFQSSDSRRAPQPLLIPSEIEPESIWAGRSRNSNDLLASVKAKAHTGDQKSNFSMDFDSPDGGKGRLLFQTLLKIEGGPRFNITDQRSYWAMMQRLDRFPADFQRCFELRDGLYFLKQR